MFNTFNTDRSSSFTSSNGDQETRKSRWGNLISELEDDWDSDDDDNGDENRLAPGLSSSTGATGIDLSSRVAPSIFGGIGRGGAPHSSSWIQDSRFEAPPGSGGGAGSAGLSARVSVNGTESPSLQIWIESHRNRADSNIRSVDGVVARKKYLEKSAQILHSLASKILGTSSDCNSNHMDTDDIVIHPNFITVENIALRETMFQGADDVSGDFVECGDSIFSHIQLDETRKKYLAMDALGRVAYEMFMMGEGPSVLKFCSKKKDNVAAAKETSMSNALSINDTITNSVEEDILEMFRKNPRTITSETDSTGITSAMLEANVPFPLCRFVADLMDDEDAMLGRSEQSFASFADVLSDLKQMVDNPDRFLHASSPNRWKLLFGEKLYGRDSEMEAFTDAADRIVPMTTDPIFGMLSGLSGKRREVVMISGNSGAGKSRLVKLGGMSLEKRGWRFLRCKFDRVVHPEPLSVLAYAFHEYLDLFARCPKHGYFDLVGDTVECSCPGSQDIRGRLTKILSNEELGILAKHIPSLRLILRGKLPSSNTIVVKPGMMHILFGKLLQVLSSKTNPVIFFVDDLQWADSFSLALLQALIQGLRPDLLNLSSAENKGDLAEDINVMFVGTYRDNEVGEDHQLSKILHQFESDSSINLTNISLSGFAFDTLNEMLSGSLSLPVRRVRSLSELVIQKTDGHPLHAIEFIQALTMDNLLTHSFERGWEWDADSIEICPITDSVAELYAFKLRRLPKDILLGLQILSCFGSQIDQQVLKFVANYDGDASVDMNTAIEVGLKEGIIEQAAQLISFSHDMLQQASLSSINDDALIPLLRKLVAALIRNASGVGEQDSVLYVIVDLINRIGSEATSSPNERALFAELNLRAGTKALAVPDFAGAAMYAESGITFLSDDNWETQYSLSLSLYETAVVSHFSSLKGNRDKLMDQIEEVFEHAKDFTDKFETRCIWIKVLAMKDIPRAVEECLNALERLGEPLHIENMDYMAVCEQLSRRKEQFSGQGRHKFLSTNRLADDNKVRAMKIMSALIGYYFQVDAQKSFMGGYVACRMIDMTTNYGHCEDSVYGAAAFASAFINILGDIEEGSAWARTSLSLMRMYNKDALMPKVFVITYGMVLAFEEPLQSTLEPLAQGIRAALETGDVEYARYNIVYYNARSFISGKKVNVLRREIEALARQLGNHFGDDTTSGDPVYNPILQFSLTAMYNTLRHFEGQKEAAEENDENSFPWDKVKLVDNDAIMKCCLDIRNFACFRNILMIQVADAFISRDMDRALQYNDLYFKHFASIKRRASRPDIYSSFFEALITLHFMRQTGEDRYQVRAQNAMLKIKGWLQHSEWNFSNKFLLIEAEMHNTQKDFEKAAVCYEASVKAAHKHKFTHEEAIASELAGIFYLDRGLHQKSHECFTRSIQCFEQWGARAMARRVQESIQSKFDTNLIEVDCVGTADVSEAFIATENQASKKRQMSD